MCIDSRDVSRPEPAIVRAGGNGCRIANSRRLDQIDIRRITGSILCNDKEGQKGESAAALGNPVTSVAWLANKLGEFGVALEPGHVILTGSFVRAFPVKTGDSIVCRFDQGFGEVKTSFA